MSIDCNIVIKLHKKFSKIIISMSIDRNIVIKLHKSGKSNNEIAKRLKMNHTTVWKIIKSFRDWKYPRLGRPSPKTDCSYPSTDKKHQGETATQLSPKLQELGC